MDMTSALRATVLTLCLFLSWDLLQRRKTSATPSRPKDAGDPAVFLFRDNVLIDATPAARQLLLLTGRQGKSLATITSLLAQRFTTLAEAINKPDAPQEETLIGEDGGDSLTILRWQNFLRLTLCDGESHAPALPAPSRGLLADELATLRAIAEDAPQLIWKEDAAGRVNWANSSYLAEATRIFPMPETEADTGIRLWPETALFTALPALGDDGKPVSARASLTFPATATAPETTRWFEVTRVRRGTQIVGFAQDASTAVAAEDSRRMLLQTLTKTFAHLSAGLAIFDKHRRLILFNPAFLDLTGLRVDFLSQRPQVHSVLDRLHDMQMLPEPRNYASWREQLAALEAAAEEGSYCETWMLPNGATYRVSGRPHGDGALAFLFEDISDETALSRQFRAEQDAAQAIFDRLPYAMAAFSRGGVMILHNTAYDRLWPRAEGMRDGLLAAQLAQELPRWQRNSLPDAAWDRIAAQLSAPASDHRGEVVQTITGQELRIVVTGLNGGVRQVEFLPLTQTDTAPISPTRARHKAPYDSGEIALMRGEA